MRPPRLSHRQVCLGGLFRPSLFPRSRQRSSGPVQLWSIDNSQSRHTLEDELNSGFRTANVHRGSTVETEPFPDLGRSHSTSAEHADRTVKSGEAMKVDISRNDLILKLGNTRLRRMLDEPTKETLPQQENRTRHDTILPSLQPASQPNRTRDDTILPSLRPASHPPNIRPTFARRQFPYAAEPASRGGAGEPSWPRQDTNIVHVGREPVSATRNTLDKVLMREITHVNMLFKEDCMVPENASTWRVRVGGEMAYQLLLQFHSGYPVVRPSVQAVSSSEKDVWLKDTADNMLLRFPVGPCLTELMAALVNELCPRQRWRNEPVDRAQRYPFGSPSEDEIREQRGENSTKIGYQELEDRMEFLCTDPKRDWPPPLPVLLRNSGYSAAFASTEFTRGLLKSKGRVAKDNERIEFLGDKIMSALYAAVMVRKHNKLDQGAMTITTSVLLSNDFFGLLSTKYGFTTKLSGMLQDLGEAGPWEPEIGKPKAKAKGDLFEAVIGGLYQDSEFQKDGWVWLLEWAEALYEPWLDWITWRLDRTTYAKWFGPSSAAAFAKHKNTIVQSRARSPHNWLTGRALHQRRPVGLQGAPIRRTLSRRG